MYKTKWDKLTEAEVLKAYLKDGKSHRRIQEEILNMDAPSHGGGFETMKILHNYGISVEKKGILANVDIESEIKNADKDYKKALELLKQVE